MGETGGFVVFGCFEGAFRQSQNGGLASSAADFWGISGRVMNRNIVRIDDRRINNLRK